MTTIAERLEGEWDAFRTHLPHHAAGQPAAAIPYAQAAPATQGTQMTILGTIHRDIANATSAIQHAWPVVDQIVTNQNVDELVEVALTAVGAGVPAEAFAAAIDALNGAIKRHAGTADQLAAAVDAGQQAVQQVAPAGVTSMQPVQTVTAPQGL